MFDARYAKHFSRTRDPQFVTLPEELDLRVAANNIGRRFDYDKAKRDMTTVKEELKAIVNAHHA